MTTLGQGFPGNEVVETAIPDDIMRTARDLVGEPNSYVSEPAVEEMTQVIARAILQERERCAKVAEDAATGCRVLQDDASAKGRRGEARDFETMKIQSVNIAHAIRKGGAP